MSEAVVLVVIPLRVGSTRLKKKIRAEIAGRSLAVRTVGRARAIFRDEARVHVVAAVDHADTEIHLRKSFPDLPVVRTDAEIPSGTDRVSIAAGLYADRLRNDGVAVRGIVNLQGDIPFVGATGLQNVARYFLESSDAQLEKHGMVTLAQSWPLDQDYGDASAVKVLTSRDGFAIYFSRQPVPYSKIPYRDAVRKDDDLAADLHIGVYGYTPAVLGRICAHAPVALELAEGLEQLRAQWLGVPILVLRTEAAAGESFRGIDTAADLKWAEGFAGGSGKKAGGRQPTRKKAAKNSAKEPAQAAKKTQKKPRRR